MSEPSQRYNPYDHEFSPFTWVKETTLFLFASGINNQIITFKAIIEIKLLTNHFD